MILINISIIHIKRIKKDLKQPNDSRAKTHPAEASETWGLSGALFYGRLLEINVI